MKIFKSNIVKGITLSVLFSFGISFVAFSQDKISKESTAFLFSVQKTPDGILLKGLEGCAWTELSFSLVPWGGTQAINQNGMVSLESGQEVANASLGNFKIIIKKTKNGIEMEGKEGTSFINLKYYGGPDDRVQLINNNGMVEPKS